MNILLLTRNESLYSSRRIREACEAEGARVQVVDPLRCVLRQDTGEILAGGDVITSADMMIPRVGTFGADYANDVFQALERQGIPTLNAADAIARAGHKGRSTAHLAHSGLAVPRTISLRYPEGIADLACSLGGFPVVVKTATGTQGNGVMLAGSVRDVERILEVWWRLGQEILLQEFVREAGGSDLRIIVLDGKAISGIRRTAAPGDFRANVHRGGSAEKLELSASMIAMAVSAAAAIGLRFAGVDLIESSAGLKILEVNASPGLEAVEEHSGVDVAAAIARQIALPGAPVSPI
jgi:ribosomal protein S6--L-glutamate ligase